MKDETSELVTLMLGPPLAIGEALLERVINQEGMLGSATDYLVKQAEKYVPLSLAQKAKGYIDGFMHPYGKINYRTGNPLAGR